LGFGFGVFLGGVVLGFCLFAYLLAYFFACLLGFWRQGLNYAAQTSLKVSKSESSYLSFPSAGKTGMDHTPVL
jgi:hypothetical protein